MNNFYYRLFCITENKFVFVWKDKTNTPPSECPNDPSHTIDINSLAIIDSESDVDELDLFWQIHKTRNGNQQMTNGAWFDNFGGTTLTGSWSGYGSRCTPLQIPYQCEIKDFTLTFRQANFDWRADEGPLHFTIAFNNHLYNGTELHSEVGALFGSFSGSNTPNGTHKYGINNFDIISGQSVFNAGEMIGARFIKTSQTGGGAINSFRDIRTTIRFGRI